MSVPTAENAEVTQRLSALPLRPLRLGGEDCRSHPFNHRSTYLPADICTKVAKSASMKLFASLDRFYDAALALLYPQTCAVCEASVERRADSPACLSCWNKAAYCHGPCCWKCGLPSLTANRYVDPQNIFCRRCDQLSFTAARAVGRYQGAIRASVLELKHQPYVSRRLADLLLRVQQTPPLNTATRIIPVPLHTQRLRVRGFNQAQLLAEAISSQTKLPLDKSSLVRTLHTERHRAGLDAEARRATVSGAFTLRSPRLIAGERILLVDDVLTTGATVSACAQALTDAGAADVFVLTLGRV